MDKPVETDRASNADEAATLSVPRASDAAVDLFACMSRFEFALKEAGFIVGEENGKAGPDWTRFEALAAAQGAFDKLRVTATTRILVDEPPRRQIRHDDTFAWSAPPKVGNMQELGAAIRQVRNNLFHGGKAGADPRDDDLCRAATAALLYLACIDLQVRAAFLGEY